MPNKLKKGFEQHGFEHTGSSETQYYGTCPFCNKTEKMYINKETNVWDCKYCGISGGYQEYLKYIYQYSLKWMEADKELSRLLARDRKVPRRFFTKNDIKVGYNINTRSFIIPGYDPKNIEKLSDLKMYRIGNRLISTGGGTKGLLIHDRLKTSNIIWIVEGEWDWYVHTAIYKNDTIICIPGAGVFRADWSAYFSNKDVRVLFDNDDAGVKGFARIHKSIGRITKQFQIIDWDEDKKKGYDLRDLWQESGDADEYRDYIDEHLLKYTTYTNKDGDGSTNDDADDVSSRIQYSDNRYDTQKVYDAFQKALYFPDISVLRVMFGALIANRLKDDPIWLFIVAPSGSAKTEIVMALRKVVDTYPISALTPHTLISGANFGQGDPSLIPKLDGKVLVIKDFTTVLEMNNTARDEIFGILRDAYDGNVEKPFGNGVMRSYESHFGIIAAVTPAIEPHTEGHTALGERFLRFKFQFKDSSSAQKDLLKKVISNTAFDTKWKDELSTVVAEALEYDFIKNQEPPQIQEEIIDRIIALAQYTALARATVMRDAYTKEITHKPFAEVGTRLTKQLYKVLLGICYFEYKKECDEETYNLIKYIALGTVPSKNQDVLTMLIKHDKGMTGQQIADKMKLPLLTTRRILENLLITGMIKKLGKGTQLSTVWVLSKKVRRLMLESQIIKPSKSKKGV